MKKLKELESRIDGLTGVIAFNMVLNILILASMLRLAHIG